MSRALGRYELLRPLARGGMAEVYLARRRAAGVEKWLVVKRIRAAFATDVRFLDLFVREARLSMSLAHQNIVPVFDFGRIDDQVFLAMERIEGKDLGSSLDRAKGRRLPPLLAAFVASECCQALDYAHLRKSPEGTALGIVHRDVTPRNVLLSWSGEVKLTDFGIAALAGDAHGKLLGTPAYMAPEQARADVVDARADLYAVGLVLREMLTGQRARPGVDRESMIEAGRTGALVPWAPDVPAAIVAIVDRATSPLAEDRFPDARSMLAELDGFMVAERAANKGESPARGVAAWLAELWAGEREDRDVDGEVGGNHLVSFLDDGALDVIGTGTQRSALATAADDAPSTPEPRARRASTTEALAPTEVSGEPTTGGASTTAKIAPAARSRAPWIAIAVIGVAALGTLGIVTLRGGDDRVEPPVAGSAVIATGSAPPLATPDAPTPDAPAIEPPLPDAAPDKPTPVKKAGSAATVRPKAGSAEVGVLRNVTINSTPWSYFWVDDDPTKHETPETIKLAPGKHRIKFDNPVVKLERSVTIEVLADRDLNLSQPLGN